MHKGPRFYGGSRLTLLHPSVLNNQKRLNIFLVGLWILQAQKASFELLDLQPDMLPLFLKQEALCLCVEGTLSQMAEAALEEIVVVEYFVLDLIDKILAGLDGLSLSI